MIRKLATWALTLAVLVIWGVVAADADTKLRHAQAAASLPA